MVRPISTDLRERLILAVQREGISARAAAARFGVSVSSAIKWVRRHRETGSVAPGKMGGKKPNVLSGHSDWLIARLKSDFTLRGLVAELAERDVNVAYVQVWRFGERGIFCVLCRKPIMEEDGELSERFFPFSERHNGGKVSILQGEINKFESGVI